MRLGSPQFVGVRLQRPFSATGPTCAGLLFAGRMMFAWDIRVFQVSSPYRMYVDESAASESRRTCGVPVTCVGFWMSTTAAGGATIPALPAAVASQPTHPGGIVFAPTTLDDPWILMLPLVVIAPFARTDGIRSRRIAFTRLIAIDFGSVELPRPTRPSDTIQKVSLLSRV